MNGIGTTTPYIINVYAIPLPIRNTMVLSLQPFLPDEQRRLIKIIPATFRFASAFLTQDKSILGVNVVAAVGWAMAGFAVQANRVQ